MTIQAETEALFKAAQALAEKAEKPFDICIYPGTGNVRGKSATLQIVGGGMCLEMTIDRVTAEQLAKEIAEEFSGEKVT